jgi:hypothetical protein
MVIAVIALIAALGGGAYAATIGFGELSKKAKVKTAGVGPLSYISTTAAVGVTGPAGQTVVASCPANTFPIGGGIRVSDDVDMFVNDSHPITGGWAGTVISFTTGSAIVSVSCAKSRKVDGAPPAS